MAFDLTNTLQLQREQVAIALRDGHFGSHVGVAFHSQGDGPKLMHLAWHRQLRVDNYPPQDGCWIAAVIDFPPARSKQIVGIARHVAKLLPEISYGTNFIASRGSFSESGEYKPPANSKGLTCATFVHELFAGIFLPLVDLSTWQSLPQNYNWANAVCDLLAQTGADKEHVDRVRGDINGLRLRPSELAAAGGCFSAATRPVAYDAVQKPADDVELARASLCDVKNSNSKKATPSGDENPIQPSISSQPQKNKDES